MKEYKLLLQLIKLQFPGVFDLNILNGGKKKKGGLLLVRILVPVFVLFLLVISFSYSYGIGMVLKQADRLDMLTELAAVIAATVVFLTTVYKIRGILFDFKDFDFLMSLPLKFTTAVLSRLALLYLINLPATLIIMIPSGIVYSLFTNWDTGAVLLQIAGALLLPMLPITAAAVAGILVAFISSRFRHSKTVNIILIFGAVLCFMAVSTFGGGKENSTAFGHALDSLVKVYPPAVLYKQAAWDKNIISALLYLLLSLGGFGALALLVGRKFIYLNTALLRKSAGRAYKAGKIKGGTPFLALYEKEMKRYFSSVNYVVNTGFGMVILTVLSVVQLFLPSAKIDTLLGGSGTLELLKGYLPEIVSFCVAMTYISASSISLEGKNLWLLKSLPLSAKKIFQSKMAVNLTMTVPFVLIDGILLSIGMGLNYKESAILLIFPICVSLFTSVSGVYFNLLLPKLDWNTEIAVIKQGMAALVALFTGMAVAMLPVAVSYVLPATAGPVGHFVAAVLVVLISGILYGLLMKSGEQKLLTLV